MSNEKSDLSNSLMQDSSRGLSKGLADKPDARQHARDAAQDLPITMYEPRFQHTYCSQCGADCGPVMKAFQVVTDTKRVTIAAGVMPMAKPEQTLREAIDGATDENTHVWCKVADVRAALDDAERYLVQVKALMHAGGRLSNIAFNLGQRGGCVLSYATANIMSESCKSWDAAIKATQ